MQSKIYPWQILSVIVAGILNEQQQQVIDYLKEENQVLREQLGSKRIRLTDDQRRRPAILGKALGHKVLTEICPIVTPDTIMRWHRKLIAHKYDGSKARRSGRPRVMLEIRMLVLRFAAENRICGYERIEGELKKLGHRVARTTVANILSENGIERGQIVPSGPLGLSFCKYIGIRSRRWISSPSRFGQRRDSLVFMCSL